LNKEKKGGVKKGRNCYAQGGLVLLTRADDHQIGCQNDGELGLWLTRHTPVGVWSLVSTCKAQHARVHMSMKLSDEAIEKLQKKYDYLINYDSIDPTDPIDPLTYVDSNGDNLMHIAAQLGDLNTITLLVDAGMNINQKGDMDSTALHYAYDGKHSHVVEFLLAHGASTEIENGFGKLPG
jgi:hypothetical protein